MKECPKINQEVPAMKKWFTIFAAAVLLAAGCSKKSAGTGPATGLAANEVVKLTGLISSVEVVRDIYGVPHIYGANEGDVAFVQGYIHAHDRLFQMIIQRGAATGQLSIIVGQSYIPTDVQARMMGFFNVAVEVYKTLLDDTEKEFLDRYAEGVNAYLQSMSIEDMPLEFVAQGITNPATIYEGILGTDGEPGWSAIDSLAFARLMTFLLSFDDEGTFGLEFMNIWENITGQLLARGYASDVTSAQTTALGWLQDIFSVYPVRGAVIDQPGSGGAVGAVTSAVTPPLAAKGAIQSFKGYMKLLRRITGLQPTSNNWSVRGELTSSGNPILANDPHLSLQQPPVFHEVHINTKAMGGTLNAAGVMFPMSPGIVIGFTDYVAWGETTTGYDVTDFYLEPIVSSAGAMKDWVVLSQGGQKPLDSAVELILYQRDSDAEDPCGISQDIIDELKDMMVDAGTPQDLSESMGQDVCILPVTYYVVDGHGPVVGMLTDDNGDPEYLVTVRWTGFEASDELGAFKGLLAAQGIDDAKNALQKFKVGAQNHNVIDRDGNIGWFPYANIPIRYPSKCTNPELGGQPNPLYLPQPGVGYCEWQGYWPSEELPQLENPEKGYIVTANNLPLSMTYNTVDGYYHGYFYDIGYRADRITQRLEDVINSGRKLTVDDMMSIQADDYLGLCEDFVNVLTSAAEKNRNTLSESALTALGYIEEWASSCTSPSGYVYDPETGSLVPASDPSTVHSSVAAAVFHAWMSNFVHFTFDDQLGKDENGNTITIHPQAYARAIYNIVKRKNCASPDLQPGEPCQYTGDARTGESVFWDDWNTSTTVETRDDIALKAFVEAISGLTEKLGPNVDDWLWGKLHTLTVRHLGDDPSKTYPEDSAEMFNIPSPFDPVINALGLSGFPRHGGQFVVDASDPGFDLMTSESQGDYSYSSGPSYRMIVEMTADGPVAYTTIPGGDVAIPSSKYYDNQLRKYWWANGYKQFPFKLDEVKAAAAYVIIFEPESAQ